MAFVSSSNNNTSSSNEAVNAAHGVTTASTQVNTAYSTYIDNLSDAVICSFFSSQPNSPQLTHENLQQIHPDDIEEMDLRWQMAMLTMRARSLVRAATTASSLEVEKDSGKDASKQGRRINAIDADEDITLVSVQDDADKEMFDVDTLNGEEVFVAGQNENVFEEIVDVAQVSTAATNVTITTEEITLVQALADLKSTKPKAKGIAFREPGESTTIFSQQLQDKGLSQDKGKGILVEPEKPLKKKV
ncbi:hypothetical protein Tco_1320001 [Tanacetum coccineum]